MSRLQGFAAAGQQILNTKIPAFFTPYVQAPLYIKLGLCLVTGVLCLNVANLSTQTSVVPVGAPETFQWDALDLTSYKTSTNNQANIYREIFKRQNAGDMAGADPMIGQLKDQELLGHVLAQRLLHSSYKASFADLKAWMAEYPDHPQANRIARLANLRAPSGQAVFQTALNKQHNIESMDDQSFAAQTYKGKIKRSAGQEDMAESLIKSVRRHVQIYEPTVALRLFNESEATIYLDSVEKDRVRAMIASGYLYAGKLEQASIMAGRALNGSGAKAPMAGWVYGLSAWQAKNYSAAAKSFEVTATSPYASGWLSSAAAYWAARSHEKTGNDRKQNQWLERAAIHPRTFYGLLAIAALEGDGDVRWNTPRLTSSQEREILSTPAGARAQKLLDAGQIDLAESEIKTLYKRGDVVRKRALMAFAFDRKLPSLSMKLAHSIRTGADDTVEAALYPTMPWTPKNGYKIDRALLHAIARQESKFNPSAQNENSGATGLMQIMPRTAYHVAKDDRFLAAAGRDLLKTPEVSLALGQKYVEELLNNKLVGQDLLSLAMAYNAGPGTLAKWKSERAGMDDPLLFIETIPFAETRNYVERVMANYWMYRMRFDQSNESMVALAGGKWARYASQDVGAVTFADARR